MARRICQEYGVNNAVGFEESSVAEGITAERQRARCSTLLESNGAEPGDKPVQKDPGAD
jgi:hypothetical protein